MCLLWVLANAGGVEISFGVGVITFCFGGGRVNCEHLGKVLVMLSFFPLSLDRSSPVLAMDNCNENEPEIY